MSFNKKQFALQFLATVALVAVLVMKTSALPSTEIIAGVFVFVFMWTGAGRAFLLEFAPFLLLLVTYKQLRNFADDLSTVDINIRNLISWEKALFNGTVPAHYLQTNLWDKPYTPALDAITNTLYVSHFLSPLLIAVALWKRDRSAYWAFAIGIVALSYAAFVTYILFPAAPPWWATMYGYLRDQPVTLHHFVVGARQVARGANPVAAMPSLHAAYPTYIAFVALHIWGRKALPIIALPVGVIFSTFYLGHHYAIDAIAGSLYALITFVTVYPWAVRYTATHDVFARRIFAGQH